MQALVLEQSEGHTVATVKQIDTDTLPPGDVTVDIDWSGINYKDALAITGKGKIIRQFPMVPGIDFAGRVHTSSDPRFHSGQPVLLTGWGWVRITGAGWPSRRGLRRTGWCQCRRAWTGAKR